MKKLLTHFVAQFPNHSKQLVALNYLLEGLLRKYFNRVNDAERICNILFNRGDILFNDHIAFRSIDIRSLLKIFLPYGYRAQMAGDGHLFNFKNKHLTALWLKHWHPAYPYIFLSECRFQEIPGADLILQPYFESFQDPIDEIDPLDSYGHLNYLHSSRWALPSLHDYQALSKKSEYLSWILYNQYYLNHFTLEIQRLKSFSFQQELLQNYKKNSPLKPIYCQQMKQFVSFLIRHQFRLNSNQNQDFHCSNDGLLLQCSTQSQTISAKFSDGYYDIPGSYVEFAYRGYKQDHWVGQIDQRNAFREGFETNNADKIFESTFIGKETYNKNAPSTSFLKETEQRIYDFLHEFN